MMKNMACQCMLRQPHVGLRQALQAGMVVVINNSWCIKSLTLSLTLTLTAIPSLLTAYTPAPARRRQRLHDVPPREDAGAKAVQQHHRHVIRASRRRHLQSHVKGHAEGGRWMTGVLMSSHSKPHFDLERQNYQERDLQ